jgi:hypothetical protein
MLSRRLFLAALLATSAWIAGAAGDEGGRSSNGNGGGGASAAESGTGEEPAESGTGEEPDDGGTEEPEQPAPSEQPVEQPNAVPESYTTIKPGLLRVRHRNGFQEEIGAGRYKMRDNRGRLIVNRVVKSSDYVRLRRLRGN